MALHPTAQKILDETVRIIDEHGEAAVRIQDVLDSCDITPPSIYHFFGNREGLVSEAQVARFRRSFVENDAVLDQILDSITSPTELRAALGAFFSMFFTPERAIERRRRMASMGSAEGRPDLEARFAEVIDTYVEERSRRLEPFQQKGWIRPDLDLRAFNHWLIGVIFGRVYIEMGHDQLEYPAWDAIAERAAAHILFGED